jgi:hypothetical protein
VVSASATPVEPTQGIAGRVGSGTAISGLRPGESPSVELRGAAPFAKVELSMLLGVGTADGFAQMSPDGAATPKGDVTAVLGNVSGVLGNVIAEPGNVVVELGVAVVGIVAVGSIAVGSVGKLVPANAFTGHGIILPAATPPTGAPRLSKMLPSPRPGALLAGLVTPAGLSGVAPPAAAPGRIGVNGGATCAALTSHERKAASAVVTSSRGA